jgi:RND family efflux transporter MFP subunit
LSRSTAGIVAIALLLAGAAAAWLMVRPREANGHDADTPMAAQPASSPGGPPAGAPAGASLPPSSEPPLPDIEVALTEEALERAGIEVAPVAASAPNAGIRIPGTVEPDAYRRVVVTPLVGGRVTRVGAELGDTVKRGATLAVIFSPGLAEAQRKYLAARAEVQATAQELARTGRLVEIGAASQQEFERTRAAHTSLTTTVESARAELQLLGMSAAAVDRLTTAGEISATITVPAPIGGVITERQANVGLNVDPSMPLFTVVDLSNVWVVGSLYERDFARVRIGSPVTITTTAYPGLALGGRVSYIDPQVDQRTRTAGVRVEVPNPRRELRLGMYADVQIGGAAGPEGVTVPRSAVQTIGDRQVVYVAVPGQRGRFIEREVRLGAFAGDTVQVVSGLAAGDAVVTRGSFFVRAERERLGLRPAAPSAAGPPIRTAPPARQPAAPARVAVTAKGFEPDRLTISAGQAARVTFLRTTEDTCAKEVVVPSLNVRLALPLNEPVVIDFSGAKQSEIAFSCGMNMLKGTLVVQ